jgi:hypothetical protein
MVVVVKPPLERKLIQVCRRVQQRFLEFTQAFQQSF